MIIIIGDSWGVGEWDENCNLSGPGFGQYMMLHDTVVNFSLGAASNTQALDRLEDLLNRFSANHQDTFYWIVTCPARCSNIEAFLESTQGILDTATYYLKMALDRAQKISSKNNILINLIGGLCDLDRIDVAHYPNLRLRVLSWGRLITKDYVTGLIDPVWWPELGERIKRSRPDLLKEWVDLSDQIISRQRCWKQIFTTCGCHPDRHGHLILRDHLYPEWSWKT